MTQKNEKWLIAIARPMFQIMTGLLSNEKPHSFLRELVRKFDAVLIPEIQVSTA